MIRGKVFLLLVLYLFSFDATAQKINVKIGSNFQEINRHRYDDYLVNYLIYPDINNPDQSILEKHTTILPREIYYQFKFGGQIASNITIVNKSSFSLKTGLELSYSVFSAYYSATGGSSNITKEVIGYIDTGEEAITTLPTVLFPTGNLSSSRCDTFVNARASVWSRDKVTANFHTLALNIPILFEYEIVKNRVSIGLESYYSIPLKTKIYSSFYDISHRQMSINNTTATVCEYIIGEDEGDYRSSWRNYNLGLDIGVKFWFGKYGTEVSYGKQFTNTFVQDQSGGPLQVSPYKAEINFIYLLNDKKEYDLGVPEEPIYKKKKKRKKKKKKKR